MTDDRYELQYFGHRVLDAIQSSVFHEQVVVGPVELDDDCRACGKRLIFVSDTDYIARFDVPTVETVRGNGRSIPGELLTAILTRMYWRNRGVRPLPEVLRPRHPAIVSVDCERCSFSRGNADVPRVVSSVLKTALDYCGFDGFEETTVGLLVVSGGGFPTPALEHLRSVARALDTWVLPHHVAIPNAHSAFEEGQLTDESLAERVETLGTDLVEYAGVESYPETTAACAVPTAD